MAGKIFGAVLSIFSFIVALLDVIDMANLVTIFPDIPDIEGIINSSILILFVSIIFFIVGIFIYKN